VDIRVWPAAEFAPGFLLVVFQAREAGLPANQPGAVHAQRIEPEPVRQLEREVEALKARLRDTLEQHDASTEELKASNEELQAMNEELRSASEELETSREELQSINEELTTVNQELKSKIDDLAHSNSDLHNLMASTAIATVFLDRQLAVMRYTPAAAPLFHLIPSDIGRPLADLRHRLEYTQLSADAEQVLAQLVPVEREVRDVQGRWFLCRHLPYRTLDDHIGGVVLACVDVTELKKAEEERAFAAAIVQSTDDSVISANFEGTITSWNKAAERLYGYSSAEALGKSVAMLSLPEDLAKVLSNAHLVEHNQAVETFDSIHVHKKGHEMWLSITLSPVRNREGKVIGISTIAREITERKRASAALEQAFRETQHAREEAEVANRTKDHFLATLSHELRTPLTPVLTAAEAMLRRKDLPPIVVEGLQMICRNIELETRFIDDLLDITRIGRGKLEFLRQPMDLHDALNAAIEVSRPDFAQHQQQLSLDLAAQSRTVNADTVRMQQVFWNLLKNASKFTPAEGQISVRTWNEPNAILVEVADSGIGIEPDFLPKVFEAFRQGDTSITRRFGGLGLGLAIAKAIVEAHEGEVSVTSPGPGRGTTLCVRLPLHKGGR
jgi:two-component system CheB/CheR fusion protein